MRAGNKWLPPSSAFHPHRWTPVPAFVLPQKFTRPHDDLDRKSLWLKTNLTTNKQTKSSPSSKIITEFQLTQFPAPAQHLTTWTLTTAQRQGLEGCRTCSATVTYLPSQWTLKKHRMSSPREVIGQFFTFLLLWLTLAEKACEFPTLSVNFPGLYLWVKIFLYHFSTSVNE